jgi:hypothetical protein
MVARELKGGRLVRLWLTDDPPSVAPIGAAPDVLMVAYYASAELGCFLALNWRLPVRILDLFTEFRNLTNGLSVPCGKGLLGALIYFGLPAMKATEKQAMRQLALRDGPYSESEQAVLLDYCQADVDALARLLAAMRPRIDLPRALLRGRYMAAVAKIEWHGIPIDVEAHDDLRSKWPGIKRLVVCAMDPRGEIFEEVPGPQVVSGERCTQPNYQGSRAQRARKNRGMQHSPDTPGPHYFGLMRFSVARFANYLARRGIPWPRLPSGALALDDKTFRAMARLYPDTIGPIRELRYTLSQLRLHELAVGADGRNRLILSAFASRTGRNQPSNSRFIFGPSCWLRSLIRPGPGRAVAYVDWSGQEYAIAAALSDDKMMQADYQSGDPYLAFGKRIGAVPSDATKHTHPHERDRLKICCGLGAMYGAGPATVAGTLGIPEWQAREWLRAHRETYSTYWRWSDSIVDEAMLTNRLRTAFGWTWHVDRDVNPRSIRNFPMQANGAEMMRLAACLMTERGIRVCCPVHDAFLIEANTDEIDRVVEAAQRAMREASELVLPGFPLRTDAKVVRYPDRYSDPRGRAMWDTVQALLVEANVSHSGTGTCPRMGHPVQLFCCSLRRFFSL